MDDFIIIGGTVNKEKPYFDFIIPAHQKLLFKSFNIHVENCNVACIKLQCNQLLDKLVFCQKFDPTEIYRQGFYIEKEISDLETFPKLYRFFLSFNTPNDYIDADINILCYLK